MQHHPTYIGVQENLLTPSSSNNMQHHPTYIGVQENLLTAVTLEDELAETEKQSGPP
jgi:hypothetical protein